MTGRERERAAGPAFYAAQARRALGIGPEHLLPRLPDIQAPLFQGALALAASALCLLGRPQLVGTLPGIAIDAALVAVTCGAIVYHARLLVPEGARPGVEVCVVPAVALVANAVALAGTDSVLLMGAAVALTGVITAAFPHLEALRVAGRAGPWARAGLDFAGTLAMLPFVLAAASTALAAPAGMAVVGCGGAALCYGARRTEDGPGGRGALIGAALVGLCLAGAARVAVRAPAQATGAAGLLLLWYALRGLVTRRERGWRRALAVLEFALIAVGAIAFLVIQAGLIPARR